MDKIIFLGPFREFLQNFIELKKSIGYKYDTEAGHLKRFDRFTNERYKKAATLTKNIVLDWCKKKDYETQTNQCSRTSIIRQFGEYLNSIGRKAYILPKGFYPKEKKYVPYIYTIDELAKFFAETDKCQYCCECPHRHQIMPVIFRMIYMCGLRASEARLLKVSQVDLKNGILTVEQAKKDNNRLVPMSKFLTELCRKYSKKVHAHSIPENYYFPALGGKPMTLIILYKNFRRFLWRAGISHGGKGHGPRVHDFRHTYAVHCLKKWVKQNKNLSAYLPLLKTYLGHDSFKETAHYLRLTADVYPDIRLKIDTKYAEIIPELKGDADETN